MILTTHILAGAAIGSQFSSPVTVFVLSILGHYFLDAFPHYEYKTLRLKDKNHQFDKKYIFQLSKVLFDFLFGLGLGLWLVWHTPFKSMALVGMLSSVIPDSLLFLAWRFPNQPALKALRVFHRSCHLSKKRAPIWLGMVIQTIVTLLIIAFLVSLRLGLFS